MQGHRLTCTFCKRPEDRVRKLVAGPGVYICDKCVELAHRIVSADEPPAGQQPLWKQVGARFRGLLGSLRSHLRARLEPGHVV